MVKPVFFSLIQDLGYAGGCKSPAGGLKGDKQTMTKKIVCAAAAALIITAALPSRSSADDKKYKIAVPVVEGLSVGSLQKTLKDMTVIIGKKSGIQIEVKEFKYKKGQDDESFLRVMNDMKSGGSDFAMVNSPVRFVKNEKQAAEFMIPSFTVTLFNKKSSYSCVYVRKSDPAKSIADLKGKRWGGVHTFEARYLMYLAGINSTMKDYFSKVSFVDDTKLADPMDALLANKIDVHVTLSYIGRMAIGSNKKYQDGIREFGCQEFEHNWVFFYRKGTPPEVVSKLKAIMLNVHKDKDFAQFKFLLSAIKGHFVDFDPADMKTTRQIASLMVKNGWDKEEKEFVKNRPK